MPTVDHSNACYYVSGGDILVPAGHLADGEEGRAPIEERPDSVSGACLASTLQFIFLLLREIHRLLNYVEKLSVIFFH